MGVHGLWRLIEPSGKPVPLETLENKILAVDVSIWLHQAIKGIQDSKGAPLPNAHLLGIYHRICKLLYFRIRPVFVFDGGVPVLKKQTIAKRNQLKTKNINDATRLQKQLLNALLKYTAVNKVISEKTKASIEEVNNSAPVFRNVNDIYKLPPSQNDRTSSSTDEEYTSDTTESSSPTKFLDVHTIDEKSSHFKSLPADVRYDILTELKETRKQSSWGRLHEIPTESDDFSAFQMKRLLKRHSVQMSLEEVEKEMGGQTLTLGELETLLNDHGVITSDSSIGSKIASDENTKYVLIKDVKKAVETAKEKALSAKTVVEEKSHCNDGTEIPSNLGNLCLETIKEDEILQSTVDTNINRECENIKINLNNEQTRIDTEYERDLELAIQLSLQDVPSSSKQSNKFDLNVPNSKDENITNSDVQLEEPEFSFLENLNEGGLESDSGDSNIEHATTKVLSSAKNYMLEYSGLTPNEIAKIIGNNTNNFCKIKDNTETNMSTNTKIQVNLTSGTVKENMLNNMESVNKIDIDEKVNNINIVDISDSGSNLSDDFLEVTEIKRPTVDTEQKCLEIIVQPFENLDDALFNDIFEKRSDSDKCHSNIEKSNDIAYNNNLKQLTNNDFLKAIITTVDKNEVSGAKELHIPESSKNNSSTIQDNVSNTLCKNATDELRTVCVNEKKLENLNENTNLLKYTIPKERCEPLTTEQLKELNVNLVQQQNDLRSEMSAKERLVSNISDQMYQEAQELMQLFGVPYITAPMEAEAQCAFLDQIDLTDGTITDDSDIWLFGGKTVYKHFFNQSKHVMEFQAENIHHSFKLSRQEMILLALLVGSDYTTGVSGIGPVTALEILAAFPPKNLTEVTISCSDLLSGLKEFQRWFKQGKISGTGRATLRNKLKNIKLSESFPSLQVVQAYLDPIVETSKEKFSWGKPDIVGLIDFAKEKFGWSHTKTNDILKPVLKRMEENTVQKQITSYFKVKHKIDSGLVESKMSKRVKTAVVNMGKEKQVMSSDEDVKVLKQIKKRSRKKVVQIEDEVKTQIEKQSLKVNVQKNSNVEVVRKIHKKETIPQKEKDKADLLRSKMKAVELFRKSKKGPGYAKKRKKVIPTLKEDAELSESSSD